MTNESSAESTADVQLAAHVHVAADVQLAADALVAAFADGRLDDYFAAFAPDATFLFHSTPQRLTSVAEYRALWQSWVDQDGFRVLGCRSSRPLIQVFGETAVFSHEVETRISTQGGPGDRPGTGDDRLPADARSAISGALACRARAPLPRCSALR